MPDEPVPDDAAGLHAANARLRELLAERDADIAGLEVRLGEERDLRRRLELRLAELERRLGMDSTDSGTPSSRERIGVREARRARQQSERERRKDRKRGGQPGHQGKGLQRDRGPGERKDAEPPAECRRARVAMAIRLRNVIDEDPCAVWAYPQIDRLSPSKIYLGGNTPDTR